MRRLRIATITVWLSTPLLLGAVAFGEQVARKNVATIQSEKKAASEVQRQPTTQARKLEPRSNAMQTAVPAAVSSDSNHALDWYSINGGGVIDASSPSYHMSASAGQMTAGEASSPSYQMGIGFWYGVGGGCSCPHQGDIAARPAGDGVIDVFDVIEEIEIAFSGLPDIQDPQCPTTRGDVDSNGVADVFDVIYLIATAFSGGPSPINPCVP